MRVRSAAAIVTVATIAITWGALSAAAAPSADPAPSATGSGQISFIVPDTASPSPSAPPSTSGSTGGSTADGSGRKTGVVGSAKDVGVGGTSSPAPAAATAPGPATASSSVEPSIAPGPASNPFPIQLDNHQVSQGAPVIVTAAGFLPGEKVLIVLYSTPVKLGVFEVSSNGQVSAEVTIPSATPSGKHHIQITGFQDGRVAGSSIDVGSSKRSGSSAFPGIVWIIAGGGIGLAAISILLAILFGWLPNVFALGTTGRKLQ